MTPQPRQQAAPAPKDPIRVPKDNDLDIITALRKKRDELQNDRQGRASTDLAPDNSRPYTRTALG